MTVPFPAFRSCVLVVLFLAISQQLVSQSVRAVDDENAEKNEEQVARKERYTNWMRDYAEKTKVKLIGGDGTQDEFAKMVPRPVFRYSDEEHRIPDATLWVWVRDSRPVAFQKVEGNNHGGGRQWTICFASLSEGLVNVSWQARPDFAAKKPGLKFNPITNADAPSDNPRLRKAQIKSLKDRFSARFGVKDDGTSGSEARIIAKALFEYEDEATKAPLGAIFGMTSTGTNPSILLLIEARKDKTGTLQWEYALARMTSFSIRARLDDNEIWAEPDAGNGAFENWLYYFLRRDFE